MSRGPDEKMPIVHDLKDGMQFDLGGRSHSYSL